MPNLVLQHPKPSIYVVEGLQAFTGVTIISSESELIEYAFINLKRGITIYKGERGFFQKPLKSVPIVILFLQLLRGLS